MFWFLLVKNTIIALLAVGIALIALTIIILVAVLVSVYRKKVRKIRIL